MSVTAPALLLERYEVVALIGQGSFGTVYQALDHRTGERVALKQLRVADATRLGQFKQEFRALQELSHVNLVRLDALFEERGTWTIAMELVEGTDLCGYVYADAAARCFDETRLVDAFSQLAAGLTTLHAAGFVHRDLKPANVRVTSAGRVVLLDFGLTTTADPRVQSSRAAGAGTVAYMAPEQAASQKVGPPADWYAFGVCLYQALTGVLPIDGPSPLAVLQLKQSFEVAAPSMQASGIPGDLDALCRQLLAIEPDQRPSAAAVRSVLSRGALARSLLPEDVRQGRPARSAFEGREAEWQELAHALGRAERGGTQVLLVLGESGIGKSTLVHQFLDEQMNDAIVLRSRCYENELLAYKAIDGAMDVLADVLCLLSDEDCEAILPPRAGLLCRLFPALAVVPALARSPLQGLAADPSVQQLEAFSIFARLIANLSQRHKPVLFAIDDLQWADVESFRLLRSWVSVQPSRCLILATVRPRTELEGDAARAIAELCALPCVTEVALGGLPEHSARAVARELLGSDADASLLEIMVKESGGHPLFLSELARFAQHNTLRGAATITLDAAIADHILALPASARTLFETVAVAGAPLPAASLGRALEISEVELGVMVTELCRHKLLRRRGAGDVACFHDRVRRVTFESLPRVRQRTLHGRIAAALVAAGNVDPGEIGRHHEAAGEFARALDAYRRAAEKALTTLAFARAAQLYSRALEMAGSLELDVKERAALMVGRGHALSRSGLSAEAARQYLAATAFAEGEEKTRLQVWAAQHLLQGAEIAEGMAAARTVLAQLGVPLATSPTAIRSRLVFDAIMLALQGVSASEPRISLAEVPPRIRMQLHALWSLSQPLAAIDVMASAGVNLRYFRIARAAREPSHMARALAEEAHLRALRNVDDPIATRMLEQARRLAASCADLELTLAVQSREADVSLLRGEAGAEAQLERALALATTRCPDRPWIRNHLRQRLGVHWTWQGEHARLAASMSAWLAEASERNDRYALAHLAGFAGGFLCHLMNDDPERARRELDAALAGWPEEPFSLAHVGWHTAVHLIHCYRGGHDGYPWLESQLPMLERRLLMKLPYGRVLLRIWRFNACIAACSTSPENTAKTAQLIAEAREHFKAARRLDLKSALTRSLLLVAQAQLAAMERGIEAAAEIELARAACTLPVGSLCLDYLLGALGRGEPGALAHHASLEFLAAQGWRNPRRAVAMWCPAIDCVEGRGRRASGYKPT